MNKTQMYYNDSCSLNQVLFCFVYFFLLYVIRGKIKYFNRIELIEKNQRLITN